MEQETNTEFEVPRSVKQVHDGKKDEEETSLDEEFIKVEKETFAPDPKMSDAASIKELLKTREKVKEVEIELDKVMNALKNCESENVVMKDQLWSAKEKLSQMAKGEEELKLQLKNLQEDLEVVLTKHKENSGIKEAFAHLNIELESSKEKMKELEQELMYSVSEVKLEEIQLKLSQEVSAKEVLEAAVEELIKKLEHTKGKCSEHETKLKLSKEDYGKVDTLAAELAIKKAELEHKLMSFQQLLSESKTSEASALQKSAHYEGLIRSCETNIEDSNKRVAELSAELERSQLQLQEHVKNFTNKDSEMKSSYENLELLMEFQKKAYEDKLAEAARKASSLLEELDQAFTKGTYLESSVEELKKMVDEAENRAAQSLSENEMLAETNSQLKSKAGELQQLLDRQKVPELKVRELDQTHVKGEDQQKHIEAMETKLEKLEVHIGALAEANMKLNEELAVSESKQNDLMSKLSQAVAEKDVAAQNLNASNKIVEDLTNELDSVRKKLQTEMSSITEQKMHLGDTGATDQTGLQTKTTELEGQLKEYQEIAEALKAKAKELEEKLLVNESDLRKEREQHAEVRTREIELDFSSPAKKENKKSESSYSQAPSESTEMQNKTVETLFSVNNLKLVFGVAIVSIIIGLILGKIY